MPPPHDRRLPTALDAAVEQVGATVGAAAARVAERLGALAQSALRVAERDSLNASLFELRRHRAALDREFERALVELIAEDLAPSAAGRRTLATADWQSLALVDDREVEDRMAADRLGQQITQDAEEALRELDARIGSLLSRGGARPDRNPLRGELLGAALHRAIAEVSKEADVRRLLVREFGAALAPALPGCYRAILDDLQRRGVQALDLTVRQVDGPGNQLPGLNSAYETVDSLRSPAAEAASRSRALHEPATASPAGSRSGSGWPTVRAGSEGRRTSDAFTGRGGTSGPGDDAGLADSALMALLRELNALDDAVDRRTAVRSGGSGFVSTLAATSTGGTMQASRFGPSSSGREATGGGGGRSGGALTGLMAANLIRAHREELVKAATGRLDHMVIDVVGSLFDQILSDARVPPQMARQIARLQLPVLRVALSDPEFFSSRRHPVRRFVNRIASLACAFDDFEDGPGRQFLERVRALVDEIVEGDFDRIALYAAKLASLEAFSEEQARRDLQPGGAVATLGAKETELRLQQRYALQLQAALQPVALPEYLRSFLSQVWSQALVVAAQRGGPDGEAVQRYRRVGRDLAMSVQPKGSPPLRKRFLMQLPGLMKDLNEGIALIGWPTAAQRELMTRLQPAHAQSLNAPPMSELDHNLLAKQLEQIFAVPLPGQETLTPNDPVPEVSNETLTRRFTPEEARRIGLVTEAAVDWSASVDIDLGRLDAGRAADAASADEPGAATVPVPALGLDIDLGEPLAGAPSGTPGAARGLLIDHLKLGFAYQMHLKNAWQKVRLAHISPGRGFFVFTCGRKHQETISMTARMLARMCETERFRVVENRYLVERATQRARKQLASLGTAAATRH